MSAEVVIDTSVWVDFLNRVDTPEATWLDRALGRRRLGLLDITLAEVLGYAPDESRAGHLQQALLKFEVFATGGAEEADVVGRYARAMRQQGVRFRRSTTCWIATYCLVNHLALLHRERDFAPFERETDLRVVDARTGVIGSKGSWRLAGER